MYDIPSDNNIEKCIITEKVVNKEEKPTIIYKNNQELA